jgi:NAD(P)-dependent dehydrogenase (short-subunit alcohol dehydrogenase family)
MNRNKIALITGASSGLGFELSKLLALNNIQVIITGRNKLLGEEKTSILTNQNLNAWFCELDVTSEESVSKAKNIILSKYSCIDILVNNAAIPLKGDTTPSLITKHNFVDALSTNCFGAINVTNCFLPLIKKSDKGSITNITSGSSTFSTVKAEIGAYKLSKNCLNYFTKLLSIELASCNIVVNAVCPGSIRTKMGFGPNALPPETAAKPIVDLILRNYDQNTGCFYRDGKISNW